MFHNTLVARYRICVCRFHSRVLQLTCHDSFSQYNSPCEFYHKHLSAHRTQWHPGKKAKVTSANSARTTSVVFQNISPSGLFFPLFLLVKLNEKCLDTPLHLQSNYRYMKISLVSTDLYSRFKHYTFFLSLIRTTHARTHTHSHF